MAASHGIATAAASAAVNPNAPPPTESRDILTLKVMRLSQPVFDSKITSSPLLTVDEIFQSSDNGCLLQKPLGSLSPASLSRPTSDNASGSPQERHSDASSEGVLDRCIDRMHSLKLPTSQGYIFTGELFHAYLNLLNNSSMDALYVTVQVQLQTDNNRYTLFDNSAEPLASLRPGNCYDFSVVHRLAERGTYALTCSVTHKLTAFSEHRTFRKSYRFTAQCPFRISHNVVHMPAGECFLECLLENASSCCVFLSEASVLCHEGVTGVRLQPPADQPRRGYKCVHYFKPKDKYSILFSLSAASPQATLDRSYLKRIENIGSLHLEWRTAVGGGGVLSDYLLTNAVTEPKEIELHVVAAPAVTQAEKPFTIDFEVVNRGHSSLQPELCLFPELLGDLCVTGASLEVESGSSTGGSSQYVVGSASAGAVDQKRTDSSGSGDVDELSGKWRRLGEAGGLANNFMVNPQRLKLLDATSTQRFRLHLLALQPGFHSLRGLQVVDTRLPNRCTDARHRLCDLVVL